MSGATEVDDGDGDSNTKEYVVCQGTGDVTVTATCDPGLSEAQLANTCWWTGGGNGTAFLSRTVSKSSCGTTVVQFYAGTSHRIITIHVVCVDSLTPSAGTL
ncbi:MAG: hypothetical protein JWM99_1095, partial [Verrucomicrobiales bacterium]|nr:hypothetical protein [Verrucomicrobiales bacterium]